jgi:hypothetical protein
MDSLNTETIEYYKDEAVKRAASDLKKLKTREKVRKEKQVKLDASIPWEEITYRAANKAKTQWLAYISGEYVKRTLNDVYGNDGWNLEIQDANWVGSSVEIHVRLHVDGQGWCATYRDGLALGQNFQGGDFAAASGVTDALKRAAATLGNSLGLQLYKQRSGAFQAAWKAIEDGQDVTEQIDSSTILADYEKSFLIHFYDFLEVNR